MTDEKVFFLTQEGMQELEAELEELKTKKRKEIAEKSKRRANSATCRRMRNTIRPKTNRPRLKNAL